MTPTNASPVLHVLVKLSILYSLPTFTALEIHNTLLLPETHWQAGSHGGLGHLC